MSQTNEELLTELQEQIALRRKRGNHQVESVALEGEEFLFTISLRTPHQVVRASRDLADILLESFRHAAPHIPPDL